MGTFFTSSEKALSAHLQSTFAEFCIQNIFFKINKYEHLKKCEGRHIQEQLFQQIKKKNICRFCSTCQSQWKRAFIKICLFWNKNGLSPAIVHRRTWCWSQGLGEEEEKVDCATSTSVSRLLFDFVRVLIPLLLREWARRSCCRSCMMANHNLS